MNEWIKWHKNGIKWSVYKYKSKKSKINKKDTSTLALTKLRPVYWPITFFLKTKLSMADFAILGKFRMWDR